MLLSDHFLGFFMVPDTEVWNYSFMGVRHSKRCSTSSSSRRPRSSTTRSAAELLLNFASMEDAAVESSEREDHFA